MRLALPVAVGAAHPAAWPACRAISAGQLRSRARGRAPTSTTSRQAGAVLRARHRAAPAGLGREALHRHHRARAHGPDRRGCPRPCSASASSRRPACGKATSTCAAAATRRSAPASFIRSHYGGVGASVSTLVRQLVRTCDGIHAVTGSIYGDESYFDSQRGEPSSGYAPDPFLEGTLSGLAFDRGASGSEKVAHAPAAYAARQLWAAAEERRRQHPRRKRPPRARLAPARAPAARAGQLADVTQLLGLMLPPSDNFFAETLAEGPRRRCRRRRHDRRRARRSSARRSPRCSASTRASSTARASQKPTAPRPMRSPTCSWRSPPRRSGAILRGNLAIAGHTGTLAKRMRDTAAVGPLPGQDRHAHRLLQPRRLLPGRQRPPARVRVLQRRHLDDAAHVLPGPHDDHARGRLHMRPSSSRKRRCRSRRAPSRPTARPSRASSRRSRRRRDSRSSSTPTRSRAAGGHDLLGGLLARPLRQRPVSTSVLPFSGPSDGAGPSSRKRRPALLQVLDQRAHALVVELRADQAAIFSPTRGLRDLLGGGARAARRRRESAARGCGR